MEKHSHTDQGMTPANPMDVIFAAAVSVCDSIKQNLHESARDLTDIRVPIFALGSDVRVELMCGPIAAATNAIEGARIRSGGRPQVDLSALDVLAGSVFLINILRERLAEQAQKGDPEATHLLSMAGDMVSHLQGMAALMNMDMEMPSGLAIKH
jgi:hypothetical protein